MEMRKHYRPVLAAIASVSIALIAVGLYYVLRPAPLLKLPSENEVAEMHASLIVHGDELIPSFKVPRSSIADIMRLLTPVGREERQHRWQELSRIELVTNRTRMTIMIFQTNTEEGAFLVWLSDYPVSSKEAIATYYRGGSDGAIEQAIRNAFKKAGLPKPESGGVS